jgi:isoaspartyl peptidase/L-asparaginase-like protein (Ntn-hydrolase superfamily)
MFDCGKLTSFRSSGTGEVTLKALLAGKIAAAINNNATLGKAVNEAILYMAKQSDDASCGVIAIDATASISI